MLHLPFDHSITSLLSSVNIFDNWNRNSATVLLLGAAGAGACLATGGATAAGAATEGTEGAESNIPVGSVDEEEATTSLTTGASFSDTLLLMCVGDAAPPIELRVELETTLLSPPTGI